VTGSIIETDVLIGGPMDGRRIYVLDGQREVRMAREDGGHESYRRETIAGERLSFLVWKWESTSIDDALAALISGYRKP
jgi:hypothetical protein